MSDEFVKHDGDKLRWELLPIRPVQEIIKVLGLGAKKYSDDNWMKGCDWIRYYAAALRHLSAWKTGEDNDPETGLSHLAHAGCCVLFLLYFVLTKTGTDNRQREVARSINNYRVPEEEWRPKEVTLLFGLFSNDGDTLMGLKDDSPPLDVGDVVKLGKELVCVTAINPSGCVYDVKRSYGSHPAALHHEGEKGVVIGKTVVV